ncbi:MAG TPA: hypothetical protein VE197_17255 [Mycobacterium sp.]|nr:hypothetical protein [Mycobacterium sp.]
MAVICAAALLLVLAATLPMATAVLLAAALLLATTLGWVIGMSGHDTTRRPMTTGGLMTTGGELAGMLPGLSGVGTAAVVVGGFSGGALEAAASRLRSIPTQKSCSRSAWRS